MLSNSRQEKKNCFYICLFRIPLPYVDKSKPNYKDSYQMEVVRYIVKNRIYKDSDLNILLENLIRRNKGLLEKDEVVEIFEKIKKELDS